MSRQVGEAFNNNLPQHFPQLARPNTVRDRTIVPIAGSAKAQPTPGAPARVAGGGAGAAPSCSSWSRSGR
ncbi:hypothetical protein J2S54_006782 [Streptomyces sp. DSM 42143]|nr:hypothetical protein [Streptomyces sp. DSM 42143]